MVDLGVSVVIPTHSARVRNGMLGRAIRSVMTQTVLPDCWYIPLDTGREGSAVTRNKGLYQVHTQWTAFLDSDDEWLPHHVQTLVDRTGDDVDVIYTGCEVRDGLGNVVPRRDEWGRFGEPFDERLLYEKSYIPVTSLVRTELAQHVGGFDTVDSIYDDWVFYRRMHAAGAKFLHVPEVTWIWHHHGRNTSGLPDRGDARLEVV